MKIDENLWLRSGQGAEFNSVQEKDLVGCLVLSGLYKSPLISRDSWMYPYQRTPMGNPNVSPIIYIVGIYG